VRAAELESEVKHSTRSLREVRSSLKMLSSTSYKCHLPSSSFGAKSADLRRGDAIPSFGIRALAASLYRGSTVVGSIHEHPSLRSPAIARWN